MRRRPAPCGELVVVGYLGDTRPDREQLQPTAWRRTADHRVGLLMHQDRREVTLDGVLGDGLDRELRRQLRIVRQGLRAEASTR